MTQLHLLASLDGQRSDLLGCNLRHQLGDAASDLDSILVELALPEQAGEHRAPQLQLGRNVPSWCALVRAKSEVEIECI
jgi:hypothetical protein